DGFRILWMILTLYRSERPLAFFGAIGFLLGITSVSLAIPIFATYLEQGIVPRLPTAVLSTGLMLLAFLSVASGLVLDTVARGRREMKLLAYLAQRAPSAEHLTTKYAVGGDNSNLAEIDRLSGQSRFKE